MNENPFDAFQQLGHMSEQLKQVFGEDFVQKMMQIPTMNLPQWMNQNYVSDGTFPWSFFASASGRPRVDVYHTRNEVVVVAEIAGLQSESEIQIQVDGRQLLLRGHVPSRYAHIGKDRFLLSELQYGSFERRIDLPAHVRSDRARAKYYQGLLEVRLVKEQSEQSEKRRKLIPILFE